MSSAEKRVYRGVQRGQRFEILVDGEKIVAYEGETIAAAMTAAGLRTLRYTKKYGQPRGLYCGIGLCQECRMVVNGVPNTQVCQTLAFAGCRVETQQSHKKGGNKN